MGDVQWIQQFETLEGVERVGEYRNGVVEVQPGATGHYHILWNGSLVVELPGGFPRDEVVEAKIDRWIQNGTEAQVVLVRADEARKAFQDNEEWGAF
jgi:hypothetical protein